MGFREFFKRFWDYFSPPKTQDALEPEGEPRDQPELEQERGGNGVENVVDERPRPRSRSGSREIPRRSQRLVGTATNRNGPDEPQPGPSRPRQSRSRSREPPRRSLRILERRTNSNRPDEPESGPSRERSRSPVLPSSHTSSLPSNIQVTEGTDGHPRYVCQTCSASFKTRQHCEYHRVCGKPWDQKRHTCESCEFGCQTRQHYNQHLTTLTHITQQKSANNKNFKCDYCFKRYVSPYRKRMHEKRVHEAKNAIPDAGDQEDRNDDDDTDEDQERE